MAKVDLVKNKAALEQAWKEVTRPESQINWAVFGYDGKTYTLKVVETGEDGFEEMVDELNGGKIMYSVCRVNDPNTNLPKLVFVNWQGEGVPANVKGVCANHLRDVTGLFKGCHVTINARSENDLDYDTVLDKVKTSSGANYSIHKEKPKPVEQIKPVGAVYKKINPIREIDVKKRDTFWNRQEEEERSRVSEEKQRTEKKKQEEEEKRKAREKKEEAVRDEMIRERSKSIDQQRAARVKHEQKRGEEEKKRYQDMMKEKERDDQEFRKRSDSERKKRLQEVQSAISSRESVDSERSKFAPAAKSKVPPLTQPKKKVPKVINEPQEAVQQLNVSTVDTVHDEPSPVEEQPPVVTEEQKELPLVPAEAKDLPETDQESLSTEVEVEQQSEDVDHQRPAAETEKEAEITSGTQDVFAARALFDYRAEGEDEINFDPGDIIEEIEKVDEGWWRGKAPSGAYGLFPANYVEIIDNEEKQPTETPTLQAPASQAEEPAPASKGLSAKALYDYQAEGEDEVSFDPGDIIEEIEKVDEGWWRGRAPSGAYGLFPANYVELLHSEEAMGTSESQPEEAQMTRQPQGISARALYDYQAADETEISFDPDDVITEIDQCDENWWRGQAPDGRYGMFPANYVELI